MTLEENLDPNKLSYGKCGGVYWVVFTRCLS